MTLVTSSSVGPARDRLPRDQPLHLRGRHAVGQPRLDRAGSDGVARDAERRHLARDDPGERLDGALRRRVHGFALEPQRHGDRREVDDPAGHGAPQQADAGLREQEGPERLVATICRADSAGVSATGFIAATPALLISTSSRPNRRRTSLNSPPHRRFVADVELCVDIALVRHRRARRGRSRSTISPCAR